MAIFHTFVTWVCVYVYLWVCVSVYNINWNNTEQEIWSIYFLNKCILDRAVHEL